MLKTLKIPAKVEDAIKIIVSFKVFFFLVITVVENLQSVKKYRDENICIEEMKEFYIKQNGLKRSTAHSVHYCNGGKYGSDILEK
tara:strand:+ start:980 stop:1234 length:255 start_codon:yes stop_codon:yes gene_type:complete